MLLLGDYVSPPSDSKWCVFTRKVEEAKESVEILLNHGDGLSKHLANAFYRSVPDIDLNGSEKDIY